MYLVPLYLFRKGGTCCCSKLFIHSHLNWIHSRTSGHPPFDRKQLHRKVQHFLFFMPAKMFWCLTLCWSSLLKQMTCQVLCNLETPTIKQEKGVKAGAHLGTRIEKGQFIEVCAVDEKWRTKTCPTLESPLSGWRRPCSQSCGLEDGDAAWNKICIHLAILTKVLWKKTVKVLLVREEQLDSSDKTPAYLTSRYSQQYI